MGFCCPYAFFRAVRGRSHQQVSDRIGSGRGTLYYWRRMIKDGRCKCTGADSCALKRFGEIPRVELPRLREGLSDPFV